MGLIEADFNSVTEEQLGSALHKMIDDGMVKQVSALLMRDVDAYSYPRIAHEMGLPHDRSKEMVIQGRQVLRRIIFGEVIA
jgi:DNA-directed RNA polymerase specialized sigma24 family protein